jgi:hypothetical protein
LMDSVSSTSWNISTFILWRHLRGDTFRVLQSIRY